MALKFMFALFAFWAMFVIVAGGLLLAAGVLPW